MKIFVFIDQCPDTMVRIPASTQIAHLVPVNPEELYLVNNRIDVHTWNDIHDGN